MAVFPENMDKLDVQDPTVSLSVIENYIRYMSERIEFAMRNLTHIVSAAGVSSAELYILVQAQAQTLAALQSALGIVQGDITELQHDMQESQGAITTLQSGLGTAQGNITDLQSAFGTAQGNIADLQSSLGAAQGDITDLQGDITDLQGNITDLQSGAQESQEAITALQNRLGAFESTDPTVKATLVDFEARLHALEQPATEQPTP